MDNAMKRSPITPLSLLLATLAAGGAQAADLTLSLIHI